MPQRIRGRIVPWLQWRRIVGASKTLHWFLIRVGKKMGIREPEHWRVRPRQLQHALTARLRGSSDMDVFYQIYFSEQYRSLRDLRDVSFVLDLGANVGFSSTYFLNCFPRSRVLAVEPDERNLAVCRINVAPYRDRVLLLPGAVWAKPTQLCLLKGTSSNGREWATQVFSPTDGAIGDVQAWDVDSLIRMAGASQVDLLKIDIERSELAVFGDSAKTWLPKIRNICIELHGRDCEEAFFGALTDYDYELEFSGELTICRELRVKRIVH